MFDDNLSINNPLHRHANPVAGHTSAVLLTFGRLLEPEELQELNRRRKNADWNNQHPHLAYHLAEDIRLKAAAAKKDPMRPRTMAEALKRR